MVEDEQVAIDIKSSHDKDCVQLTEGDFILICRIRHLAEPISLFKDR